MAAQHEVVVMEWETKRGGKKRKPEQATPRIQWWKLKEDNLKIQFRVDVLENIRLVESLQELWEETSTAILIIGQEVLGVITGRRLPGEIQEVIKAKKEAKEMWETSGRQEDKYIYRQANNAATTAVTTAKSRQ